MQSTFSPDESAMLLICTSFLEEYSGHTTPQPLNHEGSIGTIETTLVLQSQPHVPPDESYPGPPTLPIETIMLT